MLVGYLLVLISHNTDAKVLQHAFSVAV